jgi:hypothetical protein
MIARAPGHNRESKVFGAFRCLKTSPEIICLAVMTPRRERGGTAPILPHGNGCDC